MPFVDLTTFVRQPACPDWGRLDGTDVAVLGILINTALSYRVGTRFGPMRPLGTLIARREGGESFRSSADIRLMAPPLPAASRRSESE
jgi:arginase family enzyme